MLTITQLARACGVSRASILYYEQQGLLAPACRGGNGYRWYDKPQQSKLQAIISYRRFGLPLNDIRLLLDQPGMSQTQILQAHFAQLEAEIQTLRAQQKAIVALLQAPHLLEQQTVTKARWVAIMQAAGFSEADMIRWHQTFEQMEPKEHLQFLRSLGINDEEIARIRQL